jgi:hypothetical protein
MGKEIPGLNLDFLDFEADRVANKRREAQERAQGNKKTYSDYTIDEEASFLALQRKCDEEREDYPPELKKFLELKSRFVDAPDANPFNN